MGEPDPAIGDSAADLAGPPAVTAGAGVLPPSLLSPDNTSRGRRPPAPCHIHEASESMSCCHVFSVTSTSWLLLVDGSVAAAGRWPFLEPISPDRPVLAWTVAAASLHRGCLLEPRRQGDPKTVGGLGHPGASTTAGAWEVPAPLLGVGRGLLSPLIPLTLEGRPGGLPASRGLLSTWSWCCDDEALASLVAALAPAMCVCVSLGRLQSALAASAGRCRNLWGAAPRQLPQHRPR